MTGTRRRAAVGLGAALVLLTSACGSSKSSSKATTVESTAGPATSAAAGAATTAGSTSGGSTAGSGAGGAFDSAKYCSAELNLEATADAVNNSTAEPKEIATAIVGAAKPAAALAPTELQASFNGAIATLESVVESNDADTLQNFAPPPEIHAFDLKSCGWQRTDVTAQDYHFDGLPATLKAGVNDFELTNKGQEFHVLVIVKKKDGVTESFDDLLNDPEAENKTETVAAAAAAPGQPAGYAVVDLKPGEYLALCPIAQGSTGETQGTGPPHFTLGMHQTLTVT
jgi:hypothetical protein